jgi:putative aldouronate transport system permease protein
MESIIEKRKSQKGTKRRKGILYEYKKCKYLFLLLLPVLIYYAIFQYGPMYGIIVAFKDYMPFKGMLGSKWVGFKNFEQLFTGLYFLPVLRNTLLISVYKCIYGFPAPIILCLVINEIRHTVFKKTVQTITYLPHFISWVVLSGIVIEMLSPSRGPINYLIELLGYKPIFFIADVHWFRTVLVGSSIWREVGWQSILYLAAVSTIDPELYSVAEIDGAGRLRRIWNITLPSITPIIVIMLIFSVGSIINDDFDQIFNLYNVNVMSVGDVISTYTYREGLVSMNFSYGTAVGLFRNVIALTLVIITNNVARRLSGSSLW